MGIDEIHCSVSVFEFGFGEFVFGYFLIFVMVVFKWNVGDCCVECIGFFECVNFVYFGLILCWDVNC